MIPILDYRRELNAHREYSSLIVGCWQPKHSPHERLGFPTAPNVTSRLRELHLVSSVFLPACGPGTIRFLGTRSSSEQIQQYLTAGLVSHLPLVMPPRLTRLALPIRASPTVSLRVKVARYSTSPDDAVIQTQYVPAPGSGNIRVLLLNRPNARNALSKNLLTSLAQHVNSISAEGGNGPTRALVIGSNADSAFCAGADLKERLHMTKDECVVL